MDYATKEYIHRLISTIALLSPTLPYRSLNKDYDISKNVNSELCSKCGGKCCKRCGCHFSPDDFREISFDFLKKEIEKGYISIVYIDGRMIYQRIGAYILMVRHKDAPVVDDCEFKETPCILLGEKGCKLDYEQRPSGGKLLIPAEKGDCYQEYKARDCCWEWEPHQKILCELVEYFKDKEIQCSL